MKSRLFFLMLCIALTFAYCTPMIVAEQTVSSSEASANDLPPVPQNGTLMIYQAYINNLMGKLMKDCQRRVAQAEKDGVNIQSEEFVKSINKVEKEYYVRMEEALDKAIRLKNVSNKNFEKLIELRYLLFAGMARVNGNDEKTIEVNMLKFADQLRNIEREDFADKIEVSLLDNKLNGCINRFDVDEFEKIAAEIDDKVAKAGKNITSGLAQQAMLIINVGRILAVKADYSIPDERIKKYNKALSMAIVKENIPEDVLPQLALGKIQLIKMAGKISNADEKTINERIELVINYFRKRNSKAAEKIELELFDKKVTEYRFKAAYKELDKMAAEIDAEVEKAGKNITPLLAKKAMIIYMNDEMLEPLGHEAPKDRLEKYYKAFKEASDPTVNKMISIFEEGMRLREEEKNQ